MKTIRKYALTLSCALLAAGALASCESDDKNDGGSGSSPAYTLKPSKFPKEWMVSEMEHISERPSQNWKQTKTISIEYDSSNRPIQYLVYYIYSTGPYFDKDYRYEYADGTCTLYELREDGSAYSENFKGYFKNNLLVKAEWDKYVVTKVTYEGNRLVKGSNGYTLDWDKDGNITRYSDGNIKYTYTSIPNRPNFDFNMYMVSLLQDCWCDDGSQYFSYFGWTGARSANLVEREDYHGVTTNFSYTLDSKKRPTEIRAERSDGDYTETLKISYLAD